MRKQSIDGASIKDACSKKASRDKCKQQMLARSERQQTHIHTQMKVPVRSERRQIDRYQKHTRTLAGSERASANRCKKLQSIARLAQKERQHHIQMNKITHTQIAKNDLQTYPLADGCQAETKDEHVAKSRKRRGAIFTELQGFR